ncbi:MAG: PorT family protein [Leadbetterella sp.]|nr:PorT family protein [Leadbetterella sp.]MBP8155437.1 PorT family protein [Leadbetterella sp.]
MLNIFRKEVIVFGVLACWTSFTFGQIQTKFQPNYDNKKVHFGYFLGLASTHYKIKFNNSYLADVNNGMVYAISSPTSTGIKAGGLVNIYINDYLDFRFSPLSVAIYSRKLLENDSLAHNQEDKAWFEIPVQLKYKSERRNNSRMFVFAGLKYGFETNVVNKKNNITKVDNFTTKTSDFSVEYGMGLELFREYFKVTPELHFSHGIKNMINPGGNRSSFLSYVDKLKTHSVTLYIVFQ